MKETIPRFSALKWQQFTISLDSKGWFFCWLNSGHSCGHTQVVGPLGHKVHEQNNSYASVADASGCLLGHFSSPPWGLWSSKRLDCLLHMVALGQCPTIARAEVARPFKTYTWRSHNPPLMQSIGQSKSCVLPKFKEEGNSLHNLMQKVLKSLHKRAWDKLLQYLWKHLE